MPGPTRFDRELEQLENWHMCVIARLKTFRYASLKNPDPIRDAMIQYCGVVTEIMQDERERAG